MAGAGRRRGDARRAGEVARTRLLRANCTKSEATASPSEDEGPCRAKSRQRGYAVLAPLERAPRLRSGIRSIEFILGDLCQLTTPKQTPPYPRQSSITRPIPDCTGNVSAPPPAASSAKRPRLKAMRSRPGSRLGRFVLPPAKATARAPAAARPRALP